MTHICKYCINNINEIQNITADGIKNIMQNEYKMCNINSFTSCHFCMYECSESSQEMFILLNSSNENIEHIRKMLIDSDNENKQVYFVDVKNYY